MFVVLCELPYFERYLRWCKRTVDKLIIYFLLALAPIGLVKENLKIIKKKLSFILKRMFDISASGIALIILLPIFAIIGIFIKLDSKGPVFFIQERAGKDGKIFQTYKLRTMIQGADKITGNLAINEENPCWSTTHSTMSGKII